jgi:hypothetical protein
VNPSLPMWTSFAHVDFFCPCEPLLSICEPLLSICESLLPMGDVIINNLCLSVWTLFNICKPLFLICDVIVITFVKLCEHQWRHWWRHCSGVTYGWPSPPYWCSFAPTWPTGSVTPWPWCSFDLTFDRIRQIRQSQRAHFLTTIWPDLWPAPAAPAVPECPFSYYYTLSAILVLICELWHDPPNPSDPSGAEDSFTYY